MIKHGHDEAASRGWSFRMTHRVVPAVAVAIVGALSACAPVEPSPASSPTSAALPRTTEEYLSQLAADLGINDPPEVTMVRAITPAESKQVWDDCMIDSGWTASTNSEGEIGFSIPEGQEAAWDLATYRCSAAYPIDESFLQPPSDADLRTLHAYYEATYIPCLTGQGLAPEELPTLETFLADGGTWQPLDFDRTLDAIAAGQIRSFEELEATCPSRPDQG